MNRHIVAVNLEIDNEGAVKDYAIKFQATQSSASLGIAIIIDQANAQYGMSRIKLLFEIIKRVFWLRKNSKKAMKKDPQVTETLKKMYETAEKHNDRKQKIDAMFGKK